MYRKLVIHVRILVTGGAGFIGSSLTRVLLREGHDVWCMDNLFCSSKENIESLHTNRNFHFIEHDITNPLPTLGDMDQIYNLACPASPVWYQKDPVKTVRTNVEGVINVLEYARKTNARVLQASTSEVYGDPTEHPQKESYWGNVHTLGPRACYDEGKRCAETLCMDYHRQYGVDIRIARIFNTYGPYMALDDGRVVSNFIVQALTNEPITIYGDGTHTRSFQYVSDLVRGLVLLMQDCVPVTPINLGNPQEYTIQMFAEKIISLTGSTSKIVYRPLPQDDPQKRRPDITLAQVMLGWKPEVSLDEGLRLTIEYFRNTTHHSASYG